MYAVLVEVLISDLTSLRNRLFFSYIPAAPFIINAWVAGDIAVAVLGRTTWNWGIGEPPLHYSTSSPPGQRTSLSGGTA